MATITTDLICNLNQPVAATFLHGNLFSQDNAGNTINVYVLDNGAPATIGGTVSANVIRSDGNTVAVSGAIEGNKAYVILPQACYAVPGRVEIIIKLTQNTTITTIAAIVANVYRSTTDTVVDPGTIIPSISSLIAQIEAAVDSIPVDYPGLLATIAADYSSSKTYPVVGMYAWQGDVLKRNIVPITTAETYTAAHWTNAVIGDDLSALKSAISSPTPVWTVGSLVNSSGTIITEGSYAVRSAITQIMPVQPGDLIDNSAMLTKDAENHAFTLYACYYTDGVFDSRVGLMTSGNRQKTIPSGINGLRFSFMIETINMTTEIIENYINFVLYTKSTSYEEYIGFKKKTNAYIGTAMDQENPEMFVYTDFAEEAKFWMSDGSLLTDNLSHTQKFRIIPGGKCYVSNVVGQSCQGAWFNEIGEWIAPLLDSDMSSYSYNSPNHGSGTAGTYATIKEFTAPATAYYLSLNIKTSAQYKNYLASKPVLPHAGTGNIIAYKGDPTYQNKKGKKLCVIGPSTAMIDRREITQLDEFLCGWQEYVMPWYASCDIYGFSGGSMGAGYTDYISMYAGIVGEEVDLSGYDDFIIMASTNGLSTTGISDWGTVYESPSEHDSYFGGLRGIVDYIMSENPLANIYLMTSVGTKNYFGSTYVTFRNNILEINEKTRDMALKMHIRLIDLAADCGFTATSFYDSSDVTAGYTYDGTHYNQQGSEIVGKAVRKAIIGI